MKQFLKVGGLQIFEGSLKKERETEKREQEGKPHKFGRNSNTGSMEAVSEVK